MKITGLIAHLVPPRWVFAEVTTDEGVTGWGEASLEGRAEAVAGALDGFADYLVGQDPRRITEHWVALSRGGFYRGGPVLSSALSGVDQALWDILGKSLGVPVHELLGGAVRDRVRTYAPIAGDSPGELADAALARVEQGYTAVKLPGAGPLRLIDTAAESLAVAERLAAVRTAVGPHVDVALDFHGRFTVAMARRTLPLLEPFLPLFVEEPTVPEAGVRDVTAATTIPIALGERLYSRWDVRRVVDQGIAVIQPDVAHAGGISEVVRIGALAETYDVALAPHCPLGPIALAASLQVGVAAPNLLIQEQGLDVHLGGASSLLSSLVDPGAFAFHDGYLARPVRPGLGVEVDRSAVVAAAARGHRWRAPTWRRDDGSFAEW